MPIPHQVTKEFFVPSDDLIMIENEVTQNPESVQQRINDLLFLFSLVDSAFDRETQNTNNPQNQTNESNTEQAQTGSENFNSISNDFNSVSENFEVNSENFETISEGDELSENDEHEQDNTDENTESSNNKITEPDEELSEENFDDVVDLFDDPSSSERLPEENESDPNLSDLELANLLRVLQRLRNQQRINNYQEEMADYDDYN